MADNIHNYRRLTDKYGSCYVDVSDQFEHIYRVRVNLTHSVSVFSQDIYFSSCVFPRRFPETIRIQGYADPHSGAQGIPEAVTISISVEGKPRKTSRRPWDIEDTNVER